MFGAAYKEEDYQMKDLDSCCCGRATILHEQSRNKEIKFSLRFKKEILDDISIWAKGQATGPDEISEVLVVEELSGGQLLDNFPRTTFGNAKVRGSLLRLFAGDVGAGERAGVLGHSRKLRVRRKSKSAETVRGLVLGSGAELER